MEENTWNQQHCQLSLLRGRRECARIKEGSNWGIPHIADSRSCTRANYLTYSKQQHHQKEVKLLSHVWLCDPMDCSPPGSSVHGIFQARVPGFPLQGIFPAQGSNPGLPHCRQMLYHLSHQGSPRGLSSEHKAKMVISATWESFKEPHEMTHVETGAVPGPRWMEALPPRGAWGGGHIRQGVVGQSTLCTCSILRVGWACSDSRSKPSKGWARWETGWAVLGTCRSFGWAPRGGCQGS